MKKSTKVILIIVSIVLVAVIALAAVTSVIFADMLKAANSIEMLDEGLYFMEYEGDYGFDEFLEKGGASSEEEVAEYVTYFLSGGFAELDREEVSLDFGCSTLTTKELDGSYVMGRNYDYTAGTPRAMIIHTKPSNGYESYSTSWLDFLGFGGDFVPEKMSDRYKSLAAVYVPLDGINEKGLCVADLIAGDNEQTSQESDKVDVTTTTAIRLLLDKAASVDEAIELLEQYDMNSSIGRSHHLSISDSSGRSVVVEYIDDEMIVTDTPVVTNHYLSEGYKEGIGSEDSHTRFDALMELSENTLSREDMAYCMKAVSYSELTQWSIVYDIEKLELDFYWQTQFDNPLTFSIENR